MKAKLKETLTNMKGEEFKNGEIVEVKDCWINNVSNRISVDIRINDKIVITSAEHLEYIDLTPDEKYSILDNMW